MNTMPTLAATAAMTLTLMTTMAGCGSGGSTTPGTEQTSPTAPSASTTASESPTTPESTSKSPSTTESTSQSASESISPTPTREKEAGAAPAAVITIKDYAYQLPSGLQPGDKVMVENQDDVAHTVTSRDAGAFDLQIPPGATAVLTVPDTAGRYAFYCIYHADMEATLLVG